MPQATLFRLTPPSLRPFPKEYRTVAGAAPKHTFEFNVALGNVRTLLAQFERIAADDNEFLPPKLLRIDKSDDPAECGERVRRKTKVDVNEQLSWGRDEAFRKWRARIESHGIFVFQQKFPLSDCRGFTLYDSEKSPAIIINKDGPLDVGKIFTLIHEYCHLLLREPGISSQDDRHPTEAFCNKFAAAFLIPSDALRALLPTWPNTAVNWSRGDILNWAMRLKVSQMALALRLEHLGLAPPGFHRRFVGSKRVRRGTAKGGDYVATRLSEIGANYSGLVLDALMRDVIDQTQAAEALGLNVEHFDRVRATVSRQRELAGGG